MWDKRLVRFSSWLSKNEVLLEVIYRVQKLKMVGRREIYNILNS